MLDNRIPQWAPPPGWAIKWITWQMTGFTTISSNFSSQSGRIWGNENCDVLSVFILTPEQLSFVKGFWNRHWTIDMIYLNSSSLWLEKESV
jgi:hypothetical protein